MPKQPHGLTFTPEHKAWSNMLERCYLKSNISYPLYGGRGITVCEAWRSDFLAFLKHIGPRPSNLHSLDRYPDHTGNYEPGNVRWATDKEQARNRRSSKLSSEDVAEIKGLCGTMLQKDIGAKFGVQQSMISRVLSGVRWAE